MSDPNTANDFFGGWTDEQLRNYLAENGHMAPPLATHAVLVTLCANVGQNVEAQVTHRAPAMVQWAGNGSVYQGQGAFGGGQTYPHHLTMAYQGVPHAMSRPGGGRKRAFICGINYTGTESQLSGCINDARCMHYLLQHRFGFQDSQILFMTDDHPDPARRPTKANMFQGFQWLMTGLQPGDSLVFHYSGHGGQERDRTGEEADGMNETLCPMDHRYAGDIIDDQLNRMLVNPLPHGVKLHAIIDACHSGSVLDMPFTATCHAGYLRWESEYAPGVLLSNKGTAGGFAVQFGAARDFQTAADTTRLSGGVATGAATFSFIQAIERRGLGITYGELLIEMFNTLQRAGLGGNGGGGGGGGGLDAMLFGMLGGGSSFRGQEPVMSANYTFDLNFKFAI